MIKETSIISPVKTQRSSRLSQEVIILDLATEEYYGSQGVGAAIWSLLSQPRTVKEIREAILSRYQVDRQKCDRDLMGFLRQLQANGLITITPGQSLISVILQRLNHTINWISDWLMDEEGAENSLFKQPYETPTLVYCGSNNPSVYG